MKQTPCYGRWLFENKFNIELSEGPTIKSIGVVFRTQTLNADNKRLANGLLTTALTVRALKRLLSETHFFTQSIA